MSNIVNSYKDKYKGVDDRLSVMEILQKVGTTEYREGVIKKYEAVGISEVKIDGNRFRNYGAYSFIWEKTFVKSPKRSANGSLGNLNSYATFLTPHLILDFSIMSIDDYRKIMQLHYGANEFTVECYDPIYNEKIKVKMYFGTEEMAKLYTIAQNRLLPDGQWEDWVDLVGVTDYKVELIGTNNDLDLVSVRYFLNAPKQTVDGITTTLQPDFATDGGEPDVHMGEDVIIGSNTNIPQETFASRKKFRNWNTKADGSGLVFLNDYAYTINVPTQLYAQWDDMTEYRLTYNYGLADPAINDSTYQYISSIPISFGQSIGNLPAVEAPKVKYKDLDGVEHTKTDVYYNPQWWKVPTKITKLDSNGNDITSTLIVGNGDKYWANRDSTIYLLYNTRRYRLNLYLDGDLYQTNDIEYNAPTNLPLLVKSGHTFDGWYSKPDYSGAKFGGAMPPYTLNLYARWVKK